MTTNRRRSGDHPILINIMINRRRNVICGLLEVCCDLPTRSIQKRVRMSGKLQCIVSGPRIMPANQQLILSRRNIARRHRCRPPPLPMVTNSPRNTHRVCPAEIRTVKYGLRTNCGQTFIARSSLPTYLHTPLIMSAYEIIVRGHRAFIIPADHRGP